jgi:hypothetical protein
MTRLEPKSSPLYCNITWKRTATPENNISTCASVETQEITKTLATTASHRSRSRGGGGGAEAGGDGGEGEEGSDLDPEEKEGEGRPQIQISPTYLIGVMPSFSSLDTWRSRNERENEERGRRVHSLQATVVSSVWWLGLEAWKL